MNPVKGLKCTKCRHMQSSHKWFNDKWRCTKRGYVHLVGDFKPVLPNPDRKSFSWSSDEINALHQLAIAALRVPDLAVMMRQPAMVKATKKVMAARLRLVS